MSSSSGMSTSDPSASNTGTTPDTAGESEGGTDSDTPPLECRELWTACPGYPECVNLASNAGHCGECYHTCKGTGTNRRCSNYQCEPGLWPCIPRDSGIATCTEACASVGETCATDAFCSGYVGVWLTDSGNDNDPQQNLDACIHGYSPQTAFELGCNDPIDWDFTSGQRTVVGVRCCCTQP